MGDDKVILFPKGKNGGPPQSLEEIHAKLKENKEFFSEELSQDLINFIVNEVFNAGYDLDEEDKGTAVNMNLVYEAIRSVILGLDDIWHPLQDVAADLYLNDEDYEKVVDNSEVMD